MMMKNHRSHRSTALFAAYFVLQIFCIFGALPRTASIGSAITSFRSIPHNKRGLDFKLFRVRGGQSSDNTSGRVDKELVLGKDRELVHFAIDLKWVWKKVTDKMTYINFMKASWRKMKSIAGVTSSGQEFKDIAVDILHYIRSVNVGSTLKLFLGDIELAEWLATTTQRFILVYIEDGISRLPSSESIQYRRALSDNSLGDFINDKFVFYAGATQHKATLQLANALFPRANYPVLAVLRLNEGSSEVFEVLSHGGRDIESEDILDFLKGSIAAQDMKSSNGAESDSESERAYAERDFASYFQSTGPQNRGRGDSWTSDENSSRMALLTARQNEVVPGSLPAETELKRPGRALKDNGRGDEGAENAEKALVAVTVSVQSGLQFQQHFLASETLQNVAAWGLHSKAIASDDSEEFLILQPAVRFTPSNLKRTLAELRLPRSVVLSVVKRTKKSAEAFAKAAAELSAHEAGEPSKKNGRAYSPPGAPV